MSNNVTALISGVINTIHRNEVSGNGNASTIVGITAADDEIFYDEYNATTSKETIFITLKE